MLSYGYDPALSEGAVKPPVFLTSTFVFPTAEEGRDFFDYYYGRKAPPEGQAGGLVYSRFNHPNSEIVEDRLAIYEGAEGCALFSSGMAAIATTLLAFVRARATWCCIRSRCMAAPRRLVAEDAGALRRGRSGFTTAWIRQRQRAAGPRGTAHCGRVRGDLRGNAGQSHQQPRRHRADARVAEHNSEAQQGHRPLVACDNTLLGPVFQQPLQHGADISLYSLTKYVGGHSDLIAGAALGVRRH